MFNILIFQQEIIYHGAICLPKVLQKHLATYTHTQSTNFEHLNRGAACNLDELKGSRKDRMEALKPQECL